MRMKIVGFVSTFLVGAALAANAVICTNDEVPAATLLLPYFEVDLSDREGLTTQFSRPGRHLPHGLQRGQVRQRLRPQPLQPADLPGTGPLVRARMFKI